MAIRYRIKSAFTGFVEAYREVQEKLRIQLDELKEYGTLGVLK